MASIKAKLLASAFNNEELKTLEINPEKELDLLKIKKGVWVLTEKDEKNIPETISQIDELEQKIIGYLKKKGLNERVEEVFEKSLAKEELEKFKQMLKQGKIIKFKLNPSYKKAVYKLPEDLTRKKVAVTEKDLADKQSIEEYSLEKNGFLVVKNEERAKKLSEALKEKIKNGEIKGIKSFDGSFYIVEAELLESLKAKAIAAFSKNKNLSISDLAKAMNTGLIAARIACEFLKEDGSLFEKKKELMCYIE